MSIVERAQKPDISYKELEKLQLELEGLTYVTDGLYGMLTLEDTRLAILINRARDVMKDIYQ
jgi:hypothetical protein